MNKVSLIGRLTKDPILRTISDDRKVSGFILAVPNGYKKDEADFITCSIYGKLAELTVKYCGKGSLVGITGRIHTRTYEKEPGKRVYATDVIVEEIRFLATKRKEEHPPDQVEVSEERFEFPHDLKPNTLPV
ncbi:single-stranded DNA-binding protein [Chryseomicrobium palamuruense]|uniref:Single-stranded DNA-binding protein n=1 Tax=Chryseomicrobium palamuruense TaxID=682973 RepID=A0ABV8UUI9_9BACL